MNPSINMTIELIQKLHKDQFDRSGEPYYLHPIAVMNLLPSNSPKERSLIALLHDVIEDCKDTVGIAINNEKIDNLDVMKYLSKLGYDDDVLSGVLLLTRDEKIPYREDIEKIINSGNIDAMWVKACDNTHNMDKDRIAKLSGNDLAQVQKMVEKRYIPSREIILQGITKDHPNYFSYKNYRGQIALREVIPKSIRFGCTTYHPNNQWLLLGEDIERKSNREFSINDINYDLKSLNTYKVM